MSILIEQDNEIAALRRGTRRFLGIGLLLTLTIVAAILVRQGLFRQTTMLGFVTDSAQDITVGQSIKIAGFRVGAVSSVLLRADGQVQVTMEVDSSHMRFVTRDAQVLLSKEGLVGSAVLEIVPGPDKTRLASNEAQLSFSRADGLGAVINSVQEKIYPILDDLKVISGNLADPRHGTGPTLAHLNQTLASLNAMLHTTHQQVGSVGQAAGATLQQAQQTLQTVNASLPQVMDETRRIVTHVEKISAEAQTTVPPLLRDGAAVAADAREIVDGAKTAWPIRGFVAPPAQTQFNADSDPQARGGDANR